MKNLIKKPPRISIWIISRFSEKQNRLTTLGDLEEVYSEIRTTSGKRTADWWYRRQAFKSIPYFLKILMYENTTMLRVNLRTAFRNYTRNKGMTLINVSGLAIGMACCILIFLFVRDELSYDSYHKRFRQIYRVTLMEEMGGKSDHFAGVPFGAVSAFEQELPEIISLSRIVKGTGLIKAGTNEMDIEGILYADSTFFSIFSYEFLYGSSEDALKNPGSVVITEEYAERLFHKQNPP